MKTEDISNSERLRAMSGSGKRVEKILLWVLAANFAVTAIKIIVGMACGSMSVLADGFHSLSDGGANIVGLIGVRLAARPSDEGHPYGHGKFEILASAVVGIMLLSLSVNVAKTAAARLFVPQTPSFGKTELFLMAFAMLVNIVVAILEYRAGKRLESTILVTDSQHTRSDCFVSCAVLAGAFAVRAGMPAVIDSILSLGVACIVAFSACMIMKNCAKELSDGAAVDSGEVRKLLLSVPEVLDVHKVRSRGSCKSPFVDLHIVVCPDFDVRTSHELSHRLENMLKQHFGDETEVCIHIEPDEKYF